MSKKTRKDVGIFERYKPGEWYVRYKDENGRDRWKFGGSKSAAKAENLAVAVGSILREFAKRG